MIWQGYIEDRTEAGKDTARMVDAWKALGPVFSNLLPEHVNKRKCRSYASQRTAGGSSIGTVWTELGYLRTAFNSAVKAGKIPQAPEMWLPEKPDPRDRHLTRAEARKLIDAAVMPHVRLFIVLALTTAGRAGAILDLTWDRVDFERRRIALHNPERSRTRKGRATVPINDTAFEALKAAKAHALSDHVIEWGGKPVKSVKKGIAATAARAGVDDVTPHVLRHSAAVWLIEGGEPIELVAQYLGHTDVRTTFRIYARHSPEHMRTAAKALEI
jgi:integrase